MRYHFVMDTARLLFQSRTRADVLRLLFTERVVDSMSGLARRAGLSTHTVAVEVKRLESAGLVRREAFGASDVVSASFEHPVAKPLAEMLGVTQAVDWNRPDDSRVRESLAAYGAPLAAYQGRAHASLETTVVQALGFAKQDASLLKVLPLVVLKNVAKMNWGVLKEEARRAKLKAELGMLVELVADVAERPELKTRSAISTIAVGRPSPISMRREASTSAQ
jgi:hypothetical protein